MVRMNLTVEDDIPTLLAELAGSERKRGDYLTRFIRQLYAGELEATSGVDLEVLRLQLVGLAGKQKEHEGRLLQVEHGLASLTNT